MGFALPMRNVRFMLIYVPDGGQIQILNINEKEKIRSIFMNNLNDSIFIVSVRER